MSRGVSKIEQRLSSKIDNGEFYEAHQMYRTIASRYKTQKKIQDALRLLFDGAKILYEKGQPGSASDLGLLYCTMLDESETLEEKNVEQIQRLHLLTITHLDEDQPERDQFEKRILQRSIDLSKEKFGCPNIRQAFAKNYYSMVRNTTDDQLGTRLLINARNHFQFSNDGQEIAHFMITYSNFGTEDEVQYFCLQMILQLLHRKAPKTAQTFFDVFCAKHPVLKKQTFPYASPLVNFSKFLLISISEVKADAFKYIKSSYEPFLRLPDPSLFDYTEVIGEMYFGIQRKRPQKSSGGLMGMIENMMGGMNSSSMADDSEEGSEEEESLIGSNGQLNMNSIMNMANSMMSGMNRPNQSARRPAPTPRAAAPPPPKPEEDIDDLD